MSIKKKLSLKHADEENKDETDGEIKNKRDTGNLETIEEHAENAEYEELAKTSTVI